MKCLLITFPLLFSAQRVNPDALHFYGTVGVCEIAYHLTPNKKPVKRFMVGAITGLTIGVSKEIFDKYKPNPTGFDKGDLFLDTWAVLCWIQFRICLNDYKKRKLIYEPY